MIDPRQQLEDQIAQARIARMQRSQAQQSSQSGGMNPAQMYQAYQTFAGGGSAATAAPATAATTAAPAAGGATAATGGASAAGGGSGAGALASNPFTLLAAAIVAKHTLLDKNNISSSKDQFKGRALDDTLKSPTVNRYFDKAGKVGDAIKNGLEPIGQLNELDFKNFAKKSLTGPIDLFKKLFS